MVAGLAILIIAFGGWLVFKPSNNKGPAQTSTQTQTVSTTAGSAAIPTQAYIETADFKYLKPSGWVEISQNSLDSSGATSGIARPSSPTASFTIKVNQAVPKDDNDLKNSTLTELKNFLHFNLISTSSVSVNGKHGQQFVYSYSDTSYQNKITQNINVVVNRQKTFFLLFSSSAGDYDRQTSDFSAILSSFSFK